MSRGAALIFQAKCYSVSYEVGCMDRRTVLTFSSAGVAALVATAMLCASPAALAQDRAADPGTLHIGILSPFSGPFEPLGRQVERGVVLAVETYARQAGLEVTVSAADDRCDEAGGRDAANQLLGAQVDVVIGGVCWRPALAARDVLSLQNIPFYASGVRYGELTEDGVPGVLRLNGRDDRQGAFLAEALINGALDGLVGGSLRTRPLVILYTDGSYGRTLAESVRELTADAGLEVAMYEAFEPDEGMLEAASRAQAENPGLVVVLAGQADSALMVAALRDELGETPILAGDSVLTPEFPLLAGAGAEGVVFARPTVWRQHVNGDDLTALEGENAGALLGLVTPSIAATQVALAQALGQADEPYDTILGPLTFDEKGDVRRPSFELWQWGADTVWPLDREPIESDPS